MRYSKSTRYALYAAIEMAAATGDDLVTVAALSERFRIPEGALAKVMQDLVRQGIAQGVRGIGGGYRLARRASEITVLDVIATFDPPRARGLGASTDEPAADALGFDRPDGRLERLFDEVDEMARCTFASVTLETLVRQPEA